MPKFIGLRPDQDGTQEQNKSEINIEYVVELDSKNDGMEVACSVAGIPAGFSPHPTIPTARLRKKSATRQGNSAVWYVKCEYATPDNASNDEENDDPTLDIATMSISFEDREEPIKGKLNSTRVYTGGIKNSAGEIYRPAPTRTVSTMTLTITQNYEASYAVLATALSYMDCINSDTFLGLPSHSAKVVGVSPKNENRNGVPYLSIAWTIKVKPTWDKELLDIGTYYLSGSGDDHVDFLSKNGHAKQGLLDGSGHALGSGSADKFLDPFPCYTQITFSTLGLPSSLTGYKFV